MKFKFWQIIFLLIPFQVLAAYSPQQVLHQVAQSGNYNHLTNKPNFHAVATSGAYADLSGKPSLHIVATTGSYNDLTNKPVADTSNRILYYNSSGRINQVMKKWLGIITPTNATDQVIDISSAGFNTILHAKIDAFYNGNLIWCQPNTISTNSITLDLYRPNITLVSILGTNVNPIQLGNDLSNIRLHVEVMGY